MKARAAKDDDVLDLAVVGGGMAGLYVAREACARTYPKRALFEGATVLGGRVQSRTLGRGDTVFRAEGGAMRFEWGLQPRFQNLVADLGLQIEDFVPYSAPPPRGEIYHRLLPDEEACLRAPDGSLFLLWKEAIVRALRITCRSMPERLGSPAFFADGDGWIQGLDERHFEWLRTDATFPIGEHGRRPLVRDLGIWTLMRCGGILSPGALAILIEQGTFYHFLHRNINAAESLIFWIRVLRSNSSIKTITGGVGTVVNELADRARARGVQIRTEHRLVALSPAMGRSGERMVDLHFSSGAGRSRKTLTVRARQVVLALPQHALLPLAATFPPDVQASLRAVIPMAMLKCFFLVKDPWWKDDRAETHAGTDTCPAREIHYYSSPDKSLGMVMVYCDQPTYDFWTPLRGDDELTKRLRHAAFSSFMGIEEDRVEDSFVVDWTEVPHQGAAAYFWKPGARVYEVMERLSAFDFGGAPQGEPPRLHICGCAFSDFQGFIEGALRTAALTVAALHAGPEHQMAAE